MSVSLVPIPVKDRSTPSRERGYLPYTTRIRDEACVERHDMLEWVKLQSGSRASVVARIFAWEPSF
jgi:hypothetical protein